MAEARELDHEYVGTEHLLLGLLREERGIAAQVLKSLGARVDAVRGETLRLLGTPMPGRSDPAARGETSSSVLGITIHVEYQGGTGSEARFERVAEAIAFLRGIASSG